MRNLALLSVLLCSKLVVAQVNEVEGTHKCKVCLGGSHLQPSPYSIKFKKEIPYLTAGAIITALAVGIEYTNTVKPYTANELFSLDKNEINSFDRGATSNWSPNAHMASNVLISSATFLPILFLANHHTRNDLAQLVVMSGEVMLLNFGLTLLVKNVVNRPRPLTYNVNVPIGERTNATSKESFFSGHTSHTTAASILIAKVVSDYHPDLKSSIKVGLWTTMIVLPAATAYLRVKAGKHFPSDVIAGYIVGGAIGYFIPQLHKTREKETEQKMSFVPVIGSDYAALSVRIKL